MAQADDPSLSALVQAAVFDVRELAQAEVALAKSELKTVGVSLLSALATFTAACILVPIALAMLVAYGVLTLGGEPRSALAAAGAAICVVTAIGVAVCIRMLPSQHRARQVANKQADIP